MRLDIAGLSISEAYPYNTKEKKNHDILDTEKEKKEKPALEWTNTCNTQSSSST